MNMQNQMEQLEKSLQKKGIDLARKTIANTRQTIRNGHGSSANVNDSIDTSQLVESADIIEQSEESDAGEA